MANPRLLLVEDDPDIGVLIRASLSQEGELVIATTLEDARAELARSRPDLVILDLNLPDGRGEDLLPSIPRESPVVAMTAAHRILNAPGQVVSHVPKPFSPHTLRTVVQLALRRAQN